MNKQEEYEKWEDKQVMGYIGEISPRAAWNACWDLWTSYLRSMEGGTIKITCEGFKNEQTD